MIIKEYKGKYPQISQDAYVADNAVITGDALVGADTSIWFGVVVRGDYNSIEIGRNTNIQDLTLVHSDTDCPTRIGDNVTVGHTCIIHGCTIGDNVLIGMGSTVMNGVRIGENSIVGAGSLVTEGKEFSSGVLIMGRPAKVVRELTEEEIASISKSAQVYHGISKEYKKGQ